MITDVSRVGGRFSIGSGRVNLRLSSLNNADCHVFDCGALADDVLATLGQVFTLNTDGPVSFRGFDFMVLYLCFFFLFSMFSCSSLV